MARALRPGGTLSVVVTGRLGAVIGHTIAGRFADAATILADPDGRIPPADPLRRRYDPDELVEAIAAAGLAVRSVTGVGGVAALASDAARQAVRPGESELASAGRRRSPPIPCCAGWRRRCTSSPPGRPRPPRRRRRSPDTESACAADRVERTRFRGAA